MGIDFTCEEATYKMLLVLKRVNKPVYEVCVLFNQQILMACGKIHNALLQLSDVGRTNIMQDKFFTGFAWLYYMDWRKQRAKSCTHALDMYMRLNVKFTIEEFKGETFYAGIPPVTKEEIEQYINDNHQLSGFSNEKIGIDGRLHPTDSQGEFLPITDINDVYGDGTGVKLIELKGWQNEAI